MSRPKSRSSYDRPHDIYMYEEGNTVRRLEPAYVPDEEERRRRRQERRLWEQRRRHRRAARRNRERALRMSAGYVAFLSVCVLIAGMMTAVYINFQSQLLLHQETVEALENEVLDLKFDNEAIYKRLTTTVDLDAVKKQARKLGMKYTSKKHIVYYTIENSDYMTQYAK